MDSTKIKSIAKKVIQIEANAVSALRKRIDDNFELAINIILRCKGKLIISGMGKSGQISKKIAATRAATGTTANFLHPSEAIHGDLGMITEKDILMIISNSGETMELIHILPLI